MAKKEKLELEEEVIIAELNEAVKEKLELEEEVIIAELNEAVKELPILEAKEQARAYIEEAIIKIDGTHIEKLAIRPILEQVLSFF